MILWVGTEKAKVCDDDLGGLRNRLVAWAVLRTLRDKGMKENVAFARTAFTALISSEHHS